MPDLTTIKVPRELRDRLAERARRERLSLAGAALDESDDRSFWSSVAAQHAALGEEDRRSHLPGAALADPTDPADDAVSVRQSGEARRSLPR